MLQELTVSIPSWSDLAHWRPELSLLGAFLLALLGDMVTRGQRPVVPFLFWPCSLSLNHTSVYSHEGRPERTGRELGLRPQGDDPNIFPF